MSSLLLALALATAAGANAPVTDPTVVTCTATHLRALVGPFGVRTVWPTAQGLPGPLENEMGVLLSDQADVADGYSHWLVVDPEAEAAYVVQRGGHAGIQTVYGPLPLVACAEPDGATRPGRPE